MKALILAAGAGTRLGSLTDSVPKALVDVGGRTALDRVASALIDAGADRLVVNAHHLADQVEAAALALAARGVEVMVSREDEVSDAPLETGGALRLAAPHLEGEEPFIVHNADILTDVDLRALYETHLAGEAADRRIATLVVTDRPTSRPLFVDRHGVFGRANRAEGWEVVARHPDRDSAREVGFCGIHVVSPRLLPLLRERGTFSIIDAYLRLVGAGKTVAALDASDRTWHDIGTPERLAAARAAFGARSPA